MNLTRTLAAIVDADVAGHSRLTGADEEGTHKTLSVYLDAITACIENHGGQVLHYACDTILAEFASIVTVLTCVIVSAILLLCIAVLVLRYSEEKVRREGIRFPAHLGNRPDQGFRQTTSSGMMRFSTTLRTEFFSLSSASSPMTTLGLKTGSPSAAMRARVPWWISIMAAVWSMISISRKPAAAN